MCAIINSRFTLLAFPQSIDANGLLKLNIVFLPRNISPLEKITTSYNPSGAKPFVDVKPQFAIKISNNPSEFAGKKPDAPDEDFRTVTNISYSDVMNDVFIQLKNEKTTDKDGNIVPKYFDIDESRSNDKNNTTDHRAGDGLDAATSVRKYLPFSYRKAFNFTRPRVSNAVVDDSYHCAIRNDEKDPNFNGTDKKVSWGKVYAHLMRQPYLAEKAGLIYKLEVRLEPKDFAKGGWIYADIIEGDYSQEQLASELPGKEPFIKKYAAKIPPLEVGQPINLFASVLFPVMKKGESPDGIYDELFIEAIRYMDGHAGVVHSYQPHSQNILQEELDGFHPQKETGIKLGWDDEQLLVWYLRQLSIDSSVTTSTKRLDFAMGVVGYNIDVRAFGSSDWESLTAVKSVANMMLGNIPLGSFEGELPYQVYPTKISNNYWLPMYFANWNDQCMVLPDARAADIYANNLSKKDPVDIASIFTPLKNYATKLQYSHQYEFRVRLQDMSGGGTTVESEIPEDKVGVITKTHFKRYVAPNLLRYVSDGDSASTLVFSSDTINTDLNELHIKRPLLGYPAVLYTGKYEESVAIQLLIQNREQNFELQSLGKPIEGFGISDLDVQKVEIKVEVESLQMDNLASENGRENFIVLYKTSRPFNSSDPATIMDVKFRWIDQPVLNLGDASEPFDDVNLNNVLNDTELLLPTGRNIRLTLRAVCEGNEDYWGNIDDDQDDLDVRKGKITKIMVRKECMVENDLFDGKNDPLALQAIYLQPDPIPFKLNILQLSNLNGNNNSSQIPNIVQRLGSQINLEVKNLTLLAALGERSVIWCSNKIRHNLAPDASSITFSGNNELQGHWMVCTTLTIDRDWSWDGLKPTAFFLQRKTKASSNNNGIEDMNWSDIGSIDILRTASFQAIQFGKGKIVHREATKIFIIDVIDGKAATNQYPDTYEVQYKVIPNFKVGSIDSEANAFISKVCLLPVTTNPFQVPKLIGAGVALSPYMRNEVYSSTEPRKRYLWLEFEKKPDDPNDDIFARVLCNAPDQLLSNNHPNLFELPNESNLSIDPEYTRVITPDSSPEHAGLSSMQKMLQSVDGDSAFYLLPLPPGIHSESPELFGFYTYEFRIGHSDRIWSTAQARFGRPLRVAGLQHPAPNMAPVVNRDDKRLWLTVPYAKAVFNGKVVTSDPPKTSIWCLLYAQVKQADGLDHRNILLSEILLERENLKAFRHEFEVKLKKAGDNKLLKEELVHNYNMYTTLLQEADWQAVGGWTNGEINNILRGYGLPEESSLSVLCVEFFGQITNIYEHINRPTVNKDKMYQAVSEVFGQVVEARVKNEIDSKLKRNESVEQKYSEPLTSELGYHRILRTSPLIEVPFVCCTSC